MERHWDQRGRTRALLAFIGLNFILSGCLAVTLIGSVPPATKSSACRRTYAELITSLSPKFQYRLSETTVPFLEAAGRTQSIMNLGAGATITRISGPLVGETTHALRFGGAANDFADQPLDSSYLIGGELTISFFLRYQGLGAMGTVVRLGTGADESYGVLTNIDGSILYQHHNGTIFDGVSSGGTWNVGQWYHVAVTRSSNTQNIEFYRDGVLFQTAVTAGVSSGGGGRFTIGSNRHNASQALNGDIAEITAFTRVLSASDIAEIASYGVRGACD